MFVELEVVTGCNCGGVVDVGFVVVGVVVELGVGFDVVADIVVEVVELVVVVASVEIAVGFGVVVDLVVVGVAVVDVVDVAAVVVYDLVVAGLLLMEGFVVCYYW